MNQEQLKLLRNSLENLRNEKKMLQENVERRSNENLSDKARIDEINLQIQSLKAGIE